MQITESPKQKSLNGKNEFFSNSDNTQQSLIPDLQKQAEIAGIPPIDSSQKDHKRLHEDQNSKSNSTLSKSGFQDTVLATDTATDKTNNKPNNEKEISEELKEIFSRTPNKNQKTKTKKQKESESNTGSSLSKTTNFGSAIINLFSAGTLMASIAKGFFENKNDFFGLEKGREDEFSYGQTKLSESQLSQGEKFGWLTFKVGSLVNALGTLSKYINTKNPLGILGGIISVFAVPIQEKITGTLMSTIGFSMGAIGLGKESDPEHFITKEDRSYSDTIFNARKIADEISESFKDAIEFIKNPIKHLPHRQDAQTKILMNFIAYLNMIAASGGILGRAFDNKAMNRFFVRIDKVSTAFQSITELIQGIKEKWTSSFPGTAARASALYQVLGAMIFTPAALIYDSKLGKAINALASGLYGINAALTSIPGSDFNNPNSKVGIELSNKSNIIAAASTVVGIVTGLFFTKQEGNNNLINKLLKIIEFNLK